MVVITTDLLVGSEPVHFTTPCEPDFRQVFPLSHRSVRLPQHHAGTKPMCDQQFDLFRTWLGGRLLHTDGHHGGHLRVDRAIATAESSFSAANAR